MDGLSAVTYAVLCICIMWKKRCCHRHFRHLVWKLRLRVVFLHLLTDCTVSLWLCLFDNVFWNNKFFTLLTPFSGRVQSIAISISVWMSVSLAVHSHVSVTYVKNNMSKFQCIFCTCYLWPWFGPLLTAVQYIMYFWLCGWHLFSHNATNGPESKMICMLRPVRQVVALGAKSATSICIFCSFSKKE